MKPHRSLATFGSLVLLAIAAACDAPAHAGDYPAKPVMIITPPAAGGGPDVILRIVADRLGQTWQRQVMVVNRPGAGGLIAAQAVAAAPRDGYTLYMPLSSTFVVLPEVHAKLPLDLQRDIVPIGLVGEQPMVITVHPALGVNTLEELVALARKRPGEILHGGGRGGLPHLTGAMLQNRVGIELTFVPYPSAARAAQDAISGILPVYIESLSALAGALQSGALKALAVASATRLPNFPDLPTVAEAVPGLQGFEARGWFPLMAPAQAPEAIVRKVSQDLRAVLEQSEVRQKFEKLGTHARPMSPAETADFIRREQELWRPVVRQVGVDPH